MYSTLPWVEGLVDVEYVLVEMVEVVVVLVLEGWTEVDWTVGCFEDEVEK